MDEAVVEEAAVDEAAVDEVVGVVGRGLDAALGLARSSVWCRRRHWLCEVRSPYVP
ncbi:hypothetical protein [Aeromicrobium sp. UC242_57]|uniref:hypothetical protein n=1 Tax=Aeromicrobium sp. UC242_57 TaxID=3374624 RepID=UPI0037A1B2AD